jgi:predicted amidohydrolase
MMRTIGLAQLTSTNDLEENFRNCEKIAQFAQKQNVKLLCFPGTKSIVLLDQSLLQV